MRIVSTLFWIACLAGSDRLTGNPTVPDGNTSAITIAATHVTLDLNGFAIEGPNVDFGPGRTCSAPGSGIGVSTLASNVAVSNGQVRGMGSQGIQLLATGTNFRVDAVDAVMPEQSCGAGISVGSNSLVTDSTATNDAQSGINVGNSSLVLPRDQPGLRHRAGLLRG